MSLNWTPIIAAMSFVICHSSCILGCGVVWCQSAMILARTWSSAAVGEVFQVQLAHDDAYVVERLPISKTYLLPLGSFPV
jgi:hypothetical protein